MARVQLWETRSGDKSFLNELQGAGVPVPRSGELVTTPNGTYRVAEVEHVFSDFNATTQVTLIRIALPTDRIVAPFIEVTDPRD